MSQNETNLKEREMVSTPKESFAAGMRDSHKFSRGQIVHDTYTQFGGKVVKTDWWTLTSEWHVWIQNDAGEIRHFGEYRVEKS
jgi:hypothetical protein